MAYDIVSNGADPTGAVDASAIIRAGLASGAEVYIPPGVFTISRDGATSQCLTLPAHAHVYGPGTLRLAAGASVALRMLYVATDGVTVEGITLDGNKAAQSVESNLQRHAIVITGAANIAVTGVTITSTAGDGVVINGNATGTAITRTRISGADRNGVTIGTGTLTDVLIGQCHIEATVQPVDSEPSSGTSTGVRIVDNYLHSTSGDYAVTVTLAKDWTVTGNTLRGSVYLYQADGVILSGNAIDATGATALHAVRFMSGDNIVMVGNAVRTATGMHGFAPQGAPPSRLVMAGNAFVLGAGSRECYT